MPRTIREPAAGIECLLEEARSRLKAGGLRTTQARIAILEAMARKGKPQSIEAIHGALNVQCDLVTVYRSTTAMEEIGLVRRVYAHSGMALFRLALAPELYPVLASDEPETVFEEFDPPPEMRLAVQAVEDALRAKGFTRVSHAVQFYAKPRADTPRIEDSNRRSSERRTSR